jgi:hypothetical protein
MRRVRTARVAGLTLRRVTLRTRSALPISTEVTRPTSTSTVFATLSRPTLSTNRSFSIFPFRTWVAAVCAGVVALCSHRAPLCVFRYQSFSSTLAQEEVHTPGTENTGFWGWAAAGSRSNRGAATFPRYVRPSCRHPTTISTQYHGVSVCAGRRCR